MDVVVVDVVVVDVVVKSGISPSLDFRRSKPIRLIQQATTDIKTLEKW